MNRGRSTVFVMREGVDHLFRDTSAKITQKTTVAEFRESDRSRAERIVTTNLLALRSAAKYARAAKQYFAFALVLSHPPGFSWSCATVCRRTLA